MQTIISTYTVITHEAEEGGYWAEVLELPGCVSQGETMEELQKNIREAIEAVLSAQSEETRMSLRDESGLSEEDSLVLSSGSRETWTVAS